MALKAWFNEYEIVHINDNKLINDGYGALEFLRLHPSQTHEFVLYSKNLQTIFAISELCFLTEVTAESANEKNLHCIMIKSLKNDYGYIRVNPSTFGESIEHLLNSGDLNFAHYPKFEELYTVKVDTPIKAINFFTPERITLFEKVGDVSLLVSKNTILSRMVNSDTHSDWIHLLNLAAKFE